MAKFYERWPEKTAATAIELDLARLIAKQRSQSAVAMRDALGQYLGGMSARKLLKLARELSVARQFADF